MATLEDLDVRVDREESLRRTRSAGEMPRQPERAHLHLNSRFPEVDRLSYIPTNEYSSLGRSAGGGSPSSMDSRRRSETTSTLDTHSPRLGQSAPTPTPIPMPPVLLPAAVNRPDPNTNRTQPRTTSPPHMPFYLRLLIFLGIGRSASYARKALASLIWNLFWGFVQAVSIITLLILTGTLFKSTQNPKLSEWEACDHPLGSVGSVWVVRATLASFLSYWQYVRHRRALSLMLFVSFFLYRYLLHDAEANAHPQGSAQTANNHRANSNTNRNNHSNNASQNQQNRAETVQVPYNRAYSHLTLFCSFLTLSWFVGAQIYLYSSIKTCRMTSPHLWWSIFGIICITYLMIFEIIIIGLVVLIIAPILFVFWNIFLICIGRHPLQNPGIRPDIGKLPKSIVERIPLVIYIPPSPEETVNDTAFQTPHSYPPQSSTSKTQPSENRRFRFLRRFLSQPKKDKEKGKEGKFDEKHEGTSNVDQGPMSWEENWEQGEYPFVSLEGNRASCVICLMDFEEPKRRHPGAEQGDKEKEPEGPEVGSSTDATGVSSEPRQQDSDDLKLTDAGEGAQPLRLLSCGHVFHKTCLDPWLTDVSGRCPVCQRPVEVPKTSRRSRRHR